MNHHGYSRIPMWVMCKPRLLCFYFVLGIGGLLISPSTCHSRNLSSMVPVKTNLVSTRSSMVKRNQPRERRAVEVSNGMVYFQTHDYSTIISSSSDLLLLRLLHRGGGGDEQVETQAEVQMETTKDGKENVKKRKMGHKVHGKDKSKSKKNKTKKLSSVSSSSSVTPTTIKKRTKESKRMVSTRRQKEGRKIINQIMKNHTDVSTMMGDVIRTRADELLRSTNNHQNHPSFLTSLGYALGTTDTKPIMDRLENSMHPTHPDEEDESGEVHAPTSAVLANYFLQSHGGVHGIQSVSSFLSVFTGLGALLAPSFLQTTVSSPTSPTAASSSSIELMPNPIKLIFIQRTLFFAMIKHISGFLGAAYLSAQKIPLLGLSQVRKSIEQFCLDPVAQYLFYCCLLLLWTSLSSFPSSSSTFFDFSSVNSIMKNHQDKKRIDTGPKYVPWWLYSMKKITTQNTQSSTSRMSFYSTLSILGPILLREIVSTIWVLSDVLVILSSSSSSSSSSPPSPTISYHVWKMGNHIVNAFMNLLLTPKVWKNANSITRQRLLAILVGRTSLFLEICTGIFILLDTIRSFWFFAMAPVNARSTFWNLLTRITCAKLYLNFMMVRKQKIQELMQTLRGGAMYVPERVFDTLLEPKKAMGIVGETVDGKEDTEHGSSTRKIQTWMDWIELFFGF